MGKAEILREIKSAEERVRQMVAEAEEVRRQLQSEGKRKALAEAEAAEAAIRKHSDERLAKARAEVEVRKKALLDEGARRAEALSANARQNLPKAKAFVLSEFERAADA
jgi:V/A-type H+-transporting ATPase subunit G/H